MLHDVSIPLGASTPAWPGDQPFHCGWTCRTEEGDSVNLAAITTSFHVGTHADAPLHVRADWPASEALEVPAFIGPAVVLALPETHDIAQDLDVALLRSLINALGRAHHTERPTEQHDSLLPERILLRTGYSIAGGHFPADWPALTPAAAAWLVEHGVRLWGVDAPSVDRRESKTLAVHQAVLGHNAFVLENLDLRDVPVGHYELLAAPLAVHGADAAPVRALVRAIDR